MKNTAAGPQGAPRRLKRQYNRFKCRGRIDAAFAMPWRKIFNSVQTLSSEHSSDAPNSKHTRNPSRNPSPSGLLLFQSSLNSSLSGLSQPPLLSPLHLALTAGESVAVSAASWTKSLVSLAGVARQWSPSDGVPSPAKSRQSVVRWRTPAPCCKSARLSDSRDAIWICSSGKHLVEWISFETV